MLGLQIVSKQYIHIFTKKCALYHNQLLFNNNAFMQQIKISLSNSFYGFLVNIIIIGGLLETV